MSPTRRRLLARLLAVFAVLGLIAGAIAVTRFYSDAPLAKVTYGPAESSPSQVPGVDQRTLVGAIAPLLDQVDARHDGWPTEVYGELASQQLKQIGRLVSAAKSLEQEKLLHLDWIAPEFRCHALRPLPLEEVFSDGSILVRRSAARDQQEPSNQTQFAGGSLSVRLQELLSPFGDAADVRVDFKVFRVVEQSEAIETRAYFESSGRGTSGAVQQNAVWTCVWNAPNEGDESLGLRSIQVEKFEEITSGDRGQLCFDDCTETVLGGASSYAQMSRGIDHWRSRLEARYGVGRFGHGGLAIGDVNGDGLPDLYVCQSGGLPNRLYLQQSDGTVVDRSAWAGVDWMPTSRGAVFVDLDNDGDQDLAIAQSEDVMILENDGEGRFTPRLDAVGGGQFHSVTAADYDQDGRVDLYFCAYTPRTGSVSKDGPFVHLPIPYHDAVNGGPNLLLHNDGEWRFRDATQRTGLDMNNDRFSFAASWEDFDNDGDSDLYVANDFGRNNLYRNDGGKFTDVAGEFGVEDLAAGMSVTWGDYDNDGWMDLYVSNMFSGAGNRVSRQPLFRPGATQETKNAYRRHARGNSLFRGQAGRRFADISLQAGVNMGRWAWGAKFVDLNNDGREDLYVANGYVSGAADDL